MPPHDSTLPSTGTTIQSNLQAEVAQLVEQLIRNQQVVGSSPTFGSIFTRGKGNVIPEWLPIKGKPFFVVQNGAVAPKTCTVSFSETQSSAPLFLPVGVQMLHKIGAHALQGT